MSAGVLDVVAVGFAPVKGMRYVVEDEVVLDELGAVGDRELCLVDVERRQVLRTVQHPTLMRCVARVADGELSLSFPDGGCVAGAPEGTEDRVTCDYWGRPTDLTLLDGPHAEAVSAWLGRPVRLAVASRGAVVFASPVTLVGTASLRDLAERSGHPALMDEAARFRATLVVETDEPYVEEQWRGRELAAGTARLRIGVGIPRCAVVDHHPVTGQKDTRLLTLLAAYRPRTTANEPVFGVYADVIGDGTVGTRTAG